MARYFIELAYHGAAFHGWQRQPNASSVQEDVEVQLSVIAREDVSVMGCGRTDTGVHARQFFAHFDLDKELMTDELAKWNIRLNNNTHQSILIRRIFSVKDDAHVRFDALNRKYCYYVIFERDPFMRDRALFLHRRPDHKLMNEAASILFNHTDFTSFSKLHTQVKTNNCRIMEAEWKEEGQCLVFHVRADRFLRNMVRAIVGTILEVGQGRMSLDEFNQVIMLKNRSAAGTSVEAQGLFLEEVVYPYF